MTGLNISKSLIDSNSHINVKGLMRYSGYIENNAFMIPILFRIRCLNELCCETDIYAVGNYEVRGDKKEDDIERNRYRIMDLKE